MVDLVFLKSGRRFSVRFSDQHARNPVVKEAEPRSGHEPLGSFCLPLCAEPRVSSSGTVSWYF